MIYFFDNSILIFNSNNESAIPIIIKRQGMSNPKNINRIDIDFKFFISKNKPAVVIPCIRYIIEKINVILIPIIRNTRKMLFKFK